MFMHSLYVLITLKLLKQINHEINCTRPCYRVKYCDNHDILALLVNNFKLYCIYFDPKISAIQQFNYE